MERLYPRVAFVVVVVVGQQTAEEERKEKKKRVFNLDEGHTERCQTSYLETSSTCHTMVR